VLLGTLLATLLFFCHFVALVLFVITVGGLQLQRCYELAARDRRAAARELAIAVAIFVVPAGLFLCSATAGEAGATIAYARPFVASKVLAVWRTWTSADRLLDALLALAALVGAAFVSLRGEFHVARCMRWPLAFLVLAFLVAPERLFGARHVDLRLPVGIGLLAIASVDPRLRSPRSNRLAAVLIAGLLAVRAAILCYDWREYDEVIRRFTQAFARLPERSFLFVASAAPSPTLADVDLSLWQPPLKHVVSSASLGRSIFVPATWAHPSQQPITVKDRFKPIYDFQAQNPIEVAGDKALGFLVGRIRRLAAEAEEPNVPLYLLVLYPYRRGLAVPAHAKAEAEDPVFTLLAIEPPALR
jgi:hypothetical protein